MDASSHAAGRPAGDVARTRPARLGRRVQSAVQRGRVHLGHRGSGESQTAESLQDRRSRNTPQRLRRSRDPSPERSGGRTGGTHPHARECERADGSSRARAVQHAGSGAGTAPCRRSAFRNTRTIDTGGKSRLSSVRRPRARHRRRDGPGAAEPRWSAQRSSSAWNPNRRAFGRAPTRAKSRRAELGGAGGRLRRAGQLRGARRRHRSDVASDDQPLSDPTASARRRVRFVLRPRGTLRSPQPAHRGRCVPPVTS